VRLLVILSLIAQTVLAAQSGERISLGRAPAPNQTIKFHIVQDTALELAMGTSPAGTSEPTKMGAKTQIELTMRVGGKDAEGRVSADLTYDTVTASITMNGAPVSAGDAGAALLQGQTLTATYDAQGALLDVKGADSLAVSGMNLKELMMTLAGRVPTASLAIGETTAFPIDMAFPLPIPGGQSPRLTGEGVYKLESMARDGDGRIANLDYTANAKMASDVPFGDGGSVRLEIRMTGVGTGHWHVDRGYVKGSDQTMTFDGTFSGGMDMTAHGTIRVQMEGVARRP
jgi:hypothetical protein